MPTNLYGQGDNYHSDNSHVIPGLIKRFHDAKRMRATEVVAWGSGSALREFMYVDDMASACIYVMNLNKDAFYSVVDTMLSHINIGSGIEVSIKELTEMIANVVDFTGNIIWDGDKPDGAPRKLLDTSKLNKLGWNSSWELQEGLEVTYKYFLDSEWNK